jgi:hypothetical protein
MTNDIAERWQLLCQHIDAVHCEMAEFVDEPFREMLLKEARNFLSLSAPVSEEELSQRRIQRAALSGRVAAISEAAAVAKLNPQIAGIIAGEALKLCEPPLADAEQSLSALHRQLTRFVDRIAVLRRMVYPPAGGSELATDDPK